MMSDYANKLVGQNIVVVGGSTGIGYGAASALLSVGAHVTIISSQQAKIDAALQRLDSPNARGRVADVRDEEAFTGVLLELAPIGHLIFSAVDTIIRGKLAEMDLGEAKWLFGVKFWGAVVAGKALLKHDIVKPGGSLTLTSGTAALKPGSAASVGGALNGAVLSLTKGLATELSPKKIRVNTVVPGMVRTELWEKMGRSVEEQERMYEDFKEKLPVGFVADGGDVAEAYLYCVRARYATGTLVVIDGGGLLI